MTDADRSLNEVPALLEEKRRYESWLAGLEARRETTPQHVFDRVLSDYRGRLQRVEERLASHAQAIDSERASLQSRLSLLAAEEQLRRDERAELELRSHVGELAGDEATSAFRAVDDALELLVKERDDLQRKIDELSALLLNRPAESSAPPSQAAEQEAAAPSEPPKAPTPSFDELAFLSTVVGPDNAPKAAAQAPAQESTPAPSPAPVSEPEAPPPAAAAVERDVSDAESLLAGIGDSRESGSDAPLAANVPANTPIKLRTSGAIEQSKTLKCTECGAMNYPTEWYCERCGAELAAL